MKKESKFLKRIARNGFYIVLFLCISAIGISAYVMNLAENTSETIKEELDLESSLQIPFPMPEEDVFEEMIKEEVPVEIEEKEPEPVTEKETVEIANIEKKENSEETAAMEKEEKSVYTMALSGAVTAPFSGDELVKNKTLNDWRVHKGVDIKGEVGNDVLAITDGIVKSVATDEMMGNIITIEHKDNTMSIYANLEDGIKLKAGDRVKGGDAIGKVGNSALAECMEEPHLHLEVIKDGKNIDPLSLFPAGEE